MKNSTFGFVVSALVAILAGCSSTKYEKTAEYSEPEKSMSEKTMTSASSSEMARTRHVAKVAEIDFRRGGTRLSQAEKKELASLVKDARAAGKIQDVKVLAWADKDYEASGLTAPKSEVKLADMRADAVKKYIRDSLKVSEVDSHNMAKQPDAMARLFKTDDYQLKTGALEGDGALFKPEPSPQKAVVLVEIEEGM